MMMKTFNLQNVVYKEGKYFVAQCLNVDVSSFGDSEAEALTNLQEALELYFEDPIESEVIAVEAPELKTLTVQSA
jgi:predicted RNase H-like HicB family nuclease